MTIYYSASAKLFSETTENLPDDAIAVPPELFALFGLSDTPGAAEPIEEVAPQVDVEPEPPAPPPPVIWYFSAARRGFYRSDIHGDAIPEDAVEILAEDHAALLAGQAEGKEIAISNDGRPVLADPAPLTPEQLLAQYRLAVQGHIDAIAGQRGYDSGTSCASYAASTVPGWAAEAGAFVVWRDAVWQQVLGLFSDVQAGKAEIPALEDLIADLPTIDWPA